MGNSKGTIGWESLREGDVISYNTQGPATIRRNKPVSHALVFDRVELPQQGSTLSHFVIYPIVNSEELRASLRKSFALGQAAQEIGLPADQEAFVLIDPTQIYPEQLSNRDGAVRHLGSFKDLPAYDQFLDTVGRLESSGHPLQEGPKTLHTMSHAWGLLPPVGINRINAEDAFEATAVKAAKTKPKGGSKNAASVVRGVDISLDDAVKADLLPDNVAKLFTDPENKRIKRYTRLANIFDLARENPSSLEKYVSRNLELEEDVKLSDLESMGITIHPTVIWGLSEPRDGKKGEGAKPITTLKDAYHLVAHHPDDLKKYNYLGPKMQEHVATQIPEAIRQVAEKQGAKEKSAQNLASIIKAAYARLTNNFIQMEKTQTIPDRYLDQNQKPVWTFGPRQPE